MNEKKQFHTFVTLNKLALCTNLKLHRKTKLKSFGSGGPYFDRSVGLKLLHTTHM